jgi:uncharacterized protein
MSTLSDKLKALGVKVGAENLAPPRPRNPFAIENILSGRFIPTDRGDVYIVDETYPHEYHHGHTGLYRSGPLALIAEWAGDSHIQACAHDRFAYLDIETTGLSGGTGTYAFLVGVGRFEEEGFHLAQFFMRDPLEEPAQLLAIEEFLAPCETLVTYNGKAFDVPILTTRFITQGWKSPFNGLAQLDLLHLSRRLWRDRLESRTLGNVETFILGARRTQEDVPGWQIPQLYFDFLRSGDARPLKNIFYHNAMDVLALSALLNHVALLLTDPFHLPTFHGLDLLGMAKLYENLGYQAEACKLYRQSLEHDLPDELRWDTVQKLSFLYKRMGGLDEAILLWQEAARQGELYAFIELAKAYEHQRRDPQEAARWTEEALQVISAPGFPTATRREWLEDLEHRMQRLQRKLAEEEAG